MYGKSWLIFDTNSGLNDARTYVMDYLEVSKEPSSKDLFASLVKED